MCYIEDVRCLVSAICKFCKRPQQGIRSLRIHCEIEHRDEYLAIESWLGRTIDLRLESLKRLAKESMIGHHETQS